MGLMFYRFIVVYLRKIFKFKIRYSRQVLYHQVRVPSIISIPYGTPNNELWHRNLKIEFSVLPFVIGLPIPEITTG